jgi:16S rRNA (cytosine967-C5)-methyltransferase
LRLRLFSFLAHAAKVNGRPALKQASGSAITARMKQQPQTTPVSPRGIALDLLDRVLDQKRPLEEVFERHPDLAPLENRDRQFVRALTAATLRHLARIDRVLAQCLEHPLPERAHQARDLLRLGAAQLLVLNTPPHAAVDSTVALAGSYRDTAGFKGLINAVLRRIDREKAALLATVPPGASSLPDWLWQSWSTAYGPERAAEIAAAVLHEAPLDLSVKRPDETARWAEALHAEILPGGTLRLLPQADGERHLRVTELPGYAEGAWWVQDFAASLPVKLLGDVAGKRVLDLCAAPGGKTAQLAAAGAEVTAIDRSADRLKRLEQNLARLQLRARCAAADAAAWDGAKDFDAVLVDAPCSATGTLRRHPDVAWLKDPRDLAKLNAVQDRLIDAALRLTRSGGTVLYCVCTLQSEEGPDRIESASKRHPGAAHAPFDAEAVFGMPELLTGAGDLRTLPCHLGDKGGMDGFFAARLVKG